MTLTECLHQAAIELGWTEEEIQKHARFARSIGVDTDLAVQPGREAEFVQFAKKILDSEEAAKLGEKIIRERSAKN